MSEEDLIHKVAIAIRKEDKSVPTYENAANCAKAALAIALPIIEEGALSGRSEDGAKLAKEKRQADAQMAFDYANLMMPEDLRSQAKAWGLEAFMQMVWVNGFCSGYRQATRSKELS